MLRSNLYIGETPVVFVPQAPPAETHRGFYVPGAVVQHVVRRAAPP